MDEAVAGGSNIILPLWTSAHGLCVLVSRRVAVSVAMPGLCHGEETVAVPLISVPASQHFWRQRKGWRGSRMKGVGMAQRAWLCALLFCCRRKE